MSSEMQGHSTETARSTWKEYFDHACNVAFSLLREGEALTCSFSGEYTDFIRFNNGKVRQISHVEQGDITFEFSVGTKNASLTFSLSPQYDINKTRVEKNLKELQSLVPSLLEDPYFSPVHNSGQSSVEMEGSLPKTEVILEGLTSSCEGIDVAGVWGSGICYRGNRNNLGQEHWFASSSFFLDYSLYTAKERAVKGSYSGTHYDQTELQASIGQAKESLAVMELDKIELAPGKYRCYLAPSAVAEILGTWSWGGLSGGSVKRGESCLADYLSGEKTFSPLFTLTEDFTLGLDTKFNERGEVSADQICLVDKGIVKELLVSQMSQKEYSLKANGATASESPRSPVISCGDLKQEDILKTLGTGIYLSNLHYLNWSDRQSGRITGMTRFACVWVENGEIKGPIKDLRFDEKLSTIFGEGLEAVTDFAHTHVSTDTYFHRGIGGSRTPGFIVNDFTFTL